MIVLIITLLFELCVLFRFVIFNTVFQYMFAIPQKLVFFRALESLLKKDFYANIFKKTTELLQKKRKKSNNSYTLLNV